MLYVTMQQKDVYLVSSQSFCAKILLSNADEKTYFLLKPSVPHPVLRLDP